MTAASQDRLSTQLAFIVEIDKLKQVLRRTITIEGHRNENSAEHSWHVSVMAILLAEYAAGGGIDVLHTIKMMLVHDLVEIDAGDTYCYDEDAGRDRAERERRAADRIFAIAPVDQAAELRALWDEFEARTTPESRFANALDRLQALLLNYHTGGKTWREHHVELDQVTARARPIEDGSQALWHYAKALIDRAASEGLLDAKGD